MGFSSSTVSIGASTKKSDYDNLLDNTQWNKGRLDTVYSGTNTFAEAKTFSDPVTFSGTVSVEGTAAFSGGVVGETVFQSATTFSGTIIGDGASRVRVTKNNAQSIPNSSPTIVQYDDEVFDNLGEFATYAFTAKEAGYYMVSAQLESAAVTWPLTKYWMIKLYKNGAEEVNGSRDFVQVEFSNPLVAILNTIIYLAAEDYIDIRCLQDQGGAVNTSTHAETNYFNVHRLS